MIENQNSIFYLEIFYHFNAIILRFSLFVFQFKEIAPLNTNLANNSTESSAVPDLPTPVDEEFLMNYEKIDYETKDVSNGRKVYS